MAVLYVTTFNDKLYGLSGKDFIDSFLDKVSTGTLLVCYEGKRPPHVSPRILTYDMGEDKYMNNWLRNNRQRIPKSYGGDAEEDNEIFVRDREKGQYWANYRASRYFRKIVALHYALEKCLAGYIFVVDCDCIFKQDISKSFVSSLFSEGAAMIYFWGKHRKRINRGPETGFTGYCKDNKGFDFARIVCDSYENQGFLEFEYWDDGYVIGQLINKHFEEFCFRDLVGRSNRRTTRVMEIKDQPLYEHVHHFKNRHQSS